MVKRLPLHNLENEGAVDGEAIIWDASQNQWVPGLRVPSVFLEVGQTVADYETLHGVTVPYGALIFQKG